MESLTVAEASIERILDSGGKALMNAHYDKLARPYAILATEQVSGGPCAVSIHFQTL